METKIQWTGKTQNFWSGCHKVSAGCKYCYMFREKERRGQNPNIVQITSKKNFYAPLYWAPTVIFTCSMSDFFVEDADKWRRIAWEVIKETPYHTWQILTKRPERILECLPKDWGDGYNNVWLGVTVEDQSTFHRIETLSKIPAHLRFVSAEPLLEEVDFLIRSENGIRPIDSIQWLILGGESGNESGKYLYRPTELSWLYRAVTDLKEQTSVSVFVKQMGTYLSKIGKMGTLHGDNFDRFPKRLQIREMPLGVIPKGQH